jgi:hypothetical protein
MGRQRPDRLGAVTQGLLPPENGPRESHCIGSSGCEQRTYVVKSCPFYVSCRFAFQPSISTVNPKSGARPTIMKLMIKLPVRSRIAPANG